MNHPHDPLEKLVGQKLAYSCSECGAPMKIRRNKENGSLFLGCDRWPDCKSTEEIPESLRMELLGQKKLSGL